MAHTKSQKAASGNRDSASKRLGVKLFGDQKVYVGNIILRQRGMMFQAGRGARMGRDFTIYAGCDGTVQFGRRRGAQYVYVARDDDTGETRKGSDQKSPHHAVSR